MRLKDIDFKQTIGMRIIKTALAVTIGLYLSMLLNLNSPIFTSIASITSMKPSFAESFKDVKKRMFTAIFGVSLGFILGSINVPEYISPFVAGFGIIIIIYILQVFKIKDMASMSCIVFIASFLSNTDKIIYGVNRIVGTFLGIVVGVAINYLISSPDIYEDFIEEAKKTTKIATNTSKELFLYKGIRDISAFEMSYHKTDKFFGLLLKELDTPIHGKINLSLSKNIIKLLTNIDLRLNLLSNIKKGPNISDENIDLIADIYKYTILFPGELYGDLNTVYNYHMNVIFKNIKELNMLIGENNGQRNKQTAKWK